jgi:transitional endoplasmic reticulum ATPase
VPDEDGRRAILEVHTREKPLAEDVDLDDLAADMEGYVGADIEAVCREAAMNASRELITSVEPEDIGSSVSNVRITREHFEQAMDEVNPSVTEETRQRYEEIERRFEQHEEREYEDREVSRTFQ